MFYNKVMKILEELGINIPKILLPKKVDTKTWPVIACDQYTQDAEYWKRVEKIVEGCPSTYHITLPEIYLNEVDKEERIKKIKEAMQGYLDATLFDEFSGFVYVKRKTPYNRTAREGLIFALNLDSYSYRITDYALTRATEKTIKKRIPPRVAIREGAALESPHIMLLVNDKENRLFSTINTFIKEHDTPLLYKGSLMLEGGEIEGRLLNDKELNSSFTTIFNELLDSSTKFLDDRGKENKNPFLFLAGDGNHSLATAKAVWEDYKLKHKNEGAESKEVEHNCHYALVEVVNLYDRAVKFYPIHRLLFNLNKKSFMESFSDGLHFHNYTKYILMNEILNSFTELQEKLKKSRHSFGMIYIEEGKKVYRLCRIRIRRGESLAIKIVQDILDYQLSDIRTSGMLIDYIHEDEALEKAVDKDNKVGLLLPPIDKNAIFKGIKDYGVLPRKSFSIGHANEKRFYLECRKLFCKD